MSDETTETLEDNDDSINEGEKITKEEREKRSRLVMDALKSSGEEINPEDNPLSGFDVIDELCKYEFSDEEKTKLAHGMATSISQLQELQNQKKSVTSEFKSQIDALNTTINTLARKVKDGYDMRYTKCKLEKDYENKKVAVVRLDNNETVRVRPMSDEEAQMKFNERTNEMEKVD